MTDQQPQSRITADLVTGTAAMLREADAALWKRYETREKKGLPLTEDMLIRLGMLIKVKNPAFTALDLAQLLSHMRQYIRNGTLPQGEGKPHGL